MIWTHELYKQDLLTVAETDIPWGDLRNKRILVSGARGMIGSFLIDVIMLRNELFGDAIEVFALGRNEKEAKKRFYPHLDDGKLHIVPHNINEPLPAIEGVDYIIHAASNTHPVAYSSDPIGTITTNIFGTYNLLNFAVENRVPRFMLLSSVEIYGENRGDVDFFDEYYCGCIDCNTLRAGYPESKRASEALCNAYAQAHGIETIILRLSRVYGPTMLAQDSKAIAQFIAKGIAGEDIVLKSEGTQHYSYCYVADAVSGIIVALLLGRLGEAYNIAGLDSDIMLKELATVIAGIAGSKVVFQLPDEREARGYSKATKALLDISKIRKLGWTPSCTIEVGLERTLSIRRDLL